MCCATSLFEKSKFLILFVLLFSLPQYAIAVDMVSVRGDKVNLRSGPGIQYKIKWEYGVGFPLEVVKKQGDWYQVRDFEEETGWIHKAHLSKNFSLIVKANKNQEKSINIRSGPGSDSPVIGNAYYGVVFSFLEVKDDWVKVQHESGLTGWISKSLLWGF